MERCVNNHVNGQPRRVEAERDTPLLYVLRDNLGLHGSRYGCGPVRVNGMVIQSIAFLARTSRPSEAQITQALASNLCRCGTHTGIVKAMQRPAGFDPLHRLENSC